MARINLNPELSKGDRVICILMDDYKNNGVSTGMAGTVINSKFIYGGIQYFVNWDDGSKLPLLPECDKWMKEEDRLNRRRKTEESVFVTTKKNFLSENFYQQNLELFRNFNVRLLHRYFEELRKSSVTNMMGAAPYLYMGRERIKHEHHYDEMDGEQEDAFQVVLDMSDDIRDEMIRGAMKTLENAGKEVTPQSVERLMKTYSNKMVVAFTKMAGGRLMN
jgi:hypothetical protein